MSTPCHENEDMIRAANIARAMSPEVRTYVVDAFTDYFRTQADPFDAETFHAMCSGSHYITPRRIRTHGSL